VRKVFCWETRSFAEIPKNIRRVITLSPSITATLIEMGLRELIAGISPWCSILREYGYDVPYVPVVGSYERIDRDRVLELSPDLALISGGYQLRVLDQLRSLGVPTYVVRLPRGIEFLELPIELGYVLNVIDKGFNAFRKAVQELCICRSSARGSFEGLRIAVAMVIGGELVVPGFATHVTQLAEACGVRCVNAEFEFSYVWGDRARELLERASKNVDALLIQAPSPRPDVKIVSRFLDISAFRRAVVLPVLSLSDYSPSFVHRFTRIMEIVRESRGIRVVKPKEIS